MNKKEPTVSVVITCYNYAEYVGGAIESVLSQSYKNIELIIINDGSTDNSSEVINRYGKNDNVKIVNRKNKGIVFTRNEALAIAKGEFICFLDADDYFDQGYVENMVAIAQEYDADVTYPNWRVFGDREYIMTFPEFDIQRLIRQEIHCTSESLIRMASVGDHRFESEEVAEDWDFFLGMALDGRRFKLAKDCYINYRVRKSTRGTSRPYWDDMYFFYNILKKWSKKYPDIVNPVDIAIYAGKLRDDHIESQDRYIVAQKKAVREKDLLINKLSDDLNELRLSYAYRTGRLILSPLRALKGAKRKLRNNLNVLGNVSDEMLYKNNLSKISFCPSHKKVKLAVVIHLFYTETWSFFAKKLQVLERDSFDLFITIPKQNMYYSEEIKKVYENANIIVVPNRGRDVLPFIKIASQLYSLGYEYVLKIHSKKSLHRYDGKDWLEDMLDKLLPNNTKILKKMFDILAEENTGVIGPEGVYYPLTVNFPANGVHMMYVVKRLFDDRKAQKYLQVERKEYGFFGGTMFWARLGAINSLLRFPVCEFEPEAGQIDGTFSHSLERLFTVVPEMNGKINYEMSKDDVIERPYATSNVPDWSTDHLKQ